MEYNFGKTKRAGMGIALVLMLFQGTGAVRLALTPGEDAQVVLWSFVWAGVAAVAFILLTRKERKPVLAGAVTALVCGCAQIISGLVSIGQIASVAEELLSYGYGQNELNETYMTIILGSLLSGALYILIFWLVWQGIKTGGAAYPRQASSANRFDPQTGMPMQRAAYDPQTGQPLQNGSANYIFCGKCGARNTAGAAFCGACGARLGE